jgi:anti-anti-sigma regulatory factor
LAQNSVVESGGLAGAAGADPVDDPGFRVEVIHLDGSVAVAFVGELDIAGLPELGVFRSLSSRYDLDQVTILASDLTFIDPAGIGGLLGALRHFDGSGRPRLLDPPVAVRFMLEATETAVHFEISAS